MLSKSRAKIDPFAISKNNAFKEYLDTTPLPGESDACVKYTSMKECSLELKPGLSPSLLIVSHENPKLDIKFEKVARSKNKIIVR